MPSNRTTAPGSTSRAPLGRLLLVSLLALLGAGTEACSCADETFRRDVCLTACDCAEDFACANGVCVDRCSADEECPPGQFCATDGACVDDLEECNDDADCQAPEVCLQREDDGMQFCGLIPCGPDPSAGDGGMVDPPDVNECPSGLSCFNGACVREAPCGEGCADGEVCAAPRNLCVAVPVERPGCDQTCGTGLTLVLTDPRRMTGRGCLPAVCECVELPPLLPGDVGRFSDLRVFGGDSTASAYDARYGDLVYVHFNDDGLPGEVEYVDGLPDTGAVTGGPSGIRGGIGAPGADVGRHTALALDSGGEPRIAYQGEAEGELKFAARNASGMWDIHVIEGAAGMTTGFYTSMELDAEGHPHVAWFVARMKPEEDAPSVSALRYARATTPTPASAEDWVIMSVDEAPLPQPPCGEDGCDSGQSCAEMPAENPEDGEEFRCVGTTDDCTSECDSDEACVDGACRAVFVPTNIFELPEGVGLFASLVVTNDGPAIAYYDRTHGNLKVATAASAAPESAEDWTIVIADGETADGEDTGDVGRFASLAVDPMSGNLAVAYEDSSRDDLLFVELDGADGLPTNAPMVVDSGLVPPNSDLVGADAALAYDADGNAYVAYQNSTQNDLMFAVRPRGSSWRQPENLLNDGAWGYFVSLRVVVDSAYISSFKWGFDGRRPDNEFRLVTRTVP